MDGENAVLCLNVIWWEAKLFFFVYGFKFELIYIRINIDAINNDIN